MTDGRLESSRQWSLWQRTLKSERISTVQRPMRIVSDLEAITTALTSPNFDWTYSRISSSLRSRDTALCFVSGSARLLISRETYVTLNGNGRLLSGEDDSVDDIFSSPNCKIICLTMEFSVSLFLKYSMFLYQGVLERSLP